MVESGVKHHKPNQAQLNTIKKKNKKINSKCNKSYLQGIKGIIYNNNNMGVSG
jgi:hypothetical protein